jgi:hypothetical protein
MLSLFHATYFVMPAVDLVALLQLSHVILALSQGLNSQPKINLNRVSDSGCPIELLLG